MSNQDFKLSHVSSVLSHEGEPIDPNLLEWIRHHISDLTGLSPLGMVIILGLVVISIPVFIILVYLFNAPVNK